MMLFKILRLRQHAHIHIIIRHRRELVFVQQQDHLHLQLGLISSRLLQSGYFDVLSTTAFISFASASVLSPA